MVRSRDVVQAEGSARTEGARRATGVRADGAAAGAGSLAPGQTVERQPEARRGAAAAAWRIAGGLSREAGVEIYRLDAWRERAMAGLELGLKDRHGDPVAEVLDAAKRHIGELSMEIDLLRERARAAEQRLPLAMHWQVATSERDDLRGDGALFGIQRVCQVWERSPALYARRAPWRHHHNWARGRRGGGHRRGNRTRSYWFTAIRTDLARSPFHGEGHRKVHARLRILDGIRVARTRVLRVIRAHGLLSPHCGRQGAAKTHDGRVITQAPNVMWGRTACGYSRSTTGGAGSPRQSNTGTRSAWGGTCAKSGVASRHSIRLRKGSNVSMVRWTPMSPAGWRFGWTTAGQSLSDHFLKQIRYWGIHPSFGFVEERGNERGGGAILRNRTLKEQCDPRPNL